MHSIQICPTQRSVLLMETISLYLLVVAVEWRETYQGALLRAIITKWSLTFLAVLVWRLFCLCCIPQRAFATICCKIIHELSFKAMKSFWKSTVQHGYYGSNEPEIIIEQVCIAVLDAFMYSYFWNTYTLIRLQWQQKWSLHFLIFVYHLKPNWYLDILAS